MIINNMWKYVLNNTTYLPNPVITSIFLVVNIEKPDRC